MPYHTRTVMRAPREAVWLTKSSRERGVRIRNGMGARVLACCFANSNILYLAAGRALGFFYGQPEERAQINADDASCECAGQPDPGVQAAR